MYQYLFNEKKWTEIKDCSFHLSYFIHGVFEINKNCFVFGKNPDNKTGILHLGAEDKFHQFSDQNILTYNACEYKNQIFLKGKNRESRLFSPITKKWKDLNLCLDRYDFAAVEYQNQIWFLGGHCKQINNHDSLNIIEIYDPVTATQMRSPIKMITEREYASAIAYKEKLFVFGGINDYDYELNSVEMFTPASNSFVMMSPMKTPRWAFGCCRVDNLVFIIGGCISGSQEETSSVEVYNLDTDQWTEGVDFPFDCSHVRACQVKRNLFQSSKKVCDFYEGLV